MGRLRRSDLNQPGLTRIRRGRGFTYRWPNGHQVADPEVLDRISGLVIPPAWKDVWIAPWPHGHIQAVGTDQAGRRQYLYHADWRRRRDDAKYERALDFGRALPAVRRRVRADMSLSGLPRPRVTATAVRLLDVGCFRVGSEEYARDNDTYGLTTLQRQHVHLRNGQLEFRYPGKGSITHTLAVREPDVAKVIRALTARRSGPARLFVWEGDEGWEEMRSADINSYLKSLAGSQFSAKDFRTWSGTVYAALTLAAIESPARSARGQRRDVTGAIKEVAEFLGNTPAVCRSSYVDPRVIDKFEGGETIRDFDRRLLADRRIRGEALRHRAEKALIQMLQKSE